MVFGAVGFEDRLEYTVIGDAVNLSAKIEKHTKTERVRALATADAYAAAEAQGYAPPPGVGERELRPGRAVDGAQGTVDLVVLAG